jgi:hypothetical protein
MTAGIARACAVALLAEILLVIGQPSGNPLVFAGQVAASAFLAGVLTAGVRRLRARSGSAEAAEAASADGGLVTGATGTAGAALPGPSCSPASRSARS